MIITINIVNIMNRAISSKTPRKIAISSPSLSVITAGVPVEPEEDTEEEREEETDGYIVANYS